MVNRANLGNLDVNRYSDDDLRRIAEACGLKHDSDLRLLRDELDRALLRCEIARVPEKKPSMGQMKKAAGDMHAATVRLGEKFDALEEVLTFVVINRLGDPRKMGQMAEAVKNLQKLSKTVLDAAVSSTPEHEINFNSEPGQSSSLELLIGKDLPEIYHKFSGKKFGISKSVLGTVSGRRIIFLQACMEPFRPMTPMAIETHWDNYRRRHGEFGTKK